MIVDVVFKRKKALLAISMKTWRNANSVIDNLRFTVCIHAQYVQMFNFAPNATRKEEAIINKTIHLLAELIVLRLSSTATRQLWKEYLKNYNHRRLLIAQIHVNYHLNAIIVEVP